MHQTDHKAAPPPSLRSTLIEQGFVLLDREGPDGVTIRAVARAAGVSHAAPANHFPDRRNLMTELASVAFRQYLERVDAEPGPDRARAYVTALINYALAFPGRYQLIWRKDLIDWEAPAFLEQMDRAYADFLRALALTRARPDDDRPDIETLATAAWSMAHGYAVLRSTGIFDHRTDAVTGKPRAEAILDLLLGSTRKDTGPSGGF